MSLVRLSDVIERVNSKVDRNNTSLKYYLAGEHIDGKRLTIQRRGTIEGSTIGPMFYFGFKKGDVLLPSRSVASRKVAVADFDGICSEKTFVLGTKDSKVLLQSYIPCLLQSNRFWDYADINLNGSVNEFINWGALKEFEFDLPSIEQQEKIASAAWKIECEINLLENRLKILDELVKSRFIEMFGYVNTNTARWRTVTVDSVTSSRLGKMLDKKQQTGKNLHKYLGNHNVKWFEFDFNSLSEMDFDNEDQKEFSLQYGDVLMCEGGDVGRCAVWKCELSDCYYQKALHRIRCSDELNPFFFVHLIKQMADFGCLENSTNTSTISHLTGVKLKKMKIVLPPIKLQNRFVDFLQQVDKSKFKCQKHITYLKKLQQTLFDYEYVETN